MARDRRQPADKGQLGHWNTSGGLRTLTFVDTTGDTWLAVYDSGAEVGVDGVLKES